MLIRIKIKCFEGWRDAGLRVRKSLSGSKNQKRNDARLIKIKIKKNRVVGNAIGV